MNDVWLISDLHVGHTNVIKYDNLPFSTVYEMNDYILEKWNSVIEPNDNVLFLGDFFCGDMPFEQRKEFVSKLNGNIVLIKGNHDKREDAWYTEFLGFKNVVPFFISDKYFFCHFPIYEDDYFSKRRPSEQALITLLREAYKEAGCEYVFHGHAHNPKSLLLDNHYNCVANKHDFTPFKFNEKIQELKWI